MNSNGNNSSNLIAGILGLAGGVAFGLWLNSEQGQRWRKNTANMISEKSSNVQSTVVDQFSNLKSKGEELIEKGKEMIASSEASAKNWAAKNAEKAEEIVDSTADTINEKVDYAASKTQSAVEKGKTRAKQKLENIKQTASA